MALKEMISKNLKVPYVYLKDKNKFLCENGVLFSREEYLAGLDLKEAYKERSENGELYDYKFARSTGFLRKLQDRSNVKYDTKQEEVPEVVVEKLSLKKKKDSTIITLCVFLSFTSLGSMYMSTLHTATYLYDYVDVISSWLMSACITSYCSTAFEVVLLFWERKKKFLPFVFGFLWVLVVTFSMVTTVSVFYDRFNFNEYKTQEDVTKESEEENRNREVINVLKEKEELLKDSIAQKKKDIEYRSSLEWGTRQQQKELEVLQKELNDIYSKKEELVTNTYQAVKEKKEVKIVKESLWAFLGRILHIDSGVLAFVMSVLSAIFINLISPFSFTVVMSLLTNE